MRTKLFTALALLGVLSFTGCATWPKPTAQQVGQLFEVAAYTGTAIYLQKEPAKRQIFVTVVAALNALVDDPQINAAKFALALQQLPIKELKDPTATILIGSAIVLWDSYAAIPVDEYTRTADLRHLVSKVRTGIELALGQAPTETPSPLTIQRMGESGKRVPTK